MNTAPRVETRTHRATLMSEDTGPDTVPVQPGRDPRSEREFALRQSPAPRVPRQRQLDDLNAGLWAWGLFAVVAVAFVGLVIWWVTKG